MSSVAQVRRIDFDDQQIGMGFDSGSGLAVGTALGGFTSGKDPNAPGQEVSASITIVNSHEELMSRIGMSFEAQGRYGFVSGGAKAEFAESSQYNSTSTFLVASCVVQNPFTRGSGFAVTAPAGELLTALRFDEFRRAFGDSFVRGIQTGGEFYCVIRITSVSEVKQRDLALTLHAEANGLVASASFQAKFTEANSSSSTRSEYSATMLQRAGSGTTIAPTVEISEAIARYKNFPQIVADSPVAYEIEVATYDTIPLPVPTPDEQENFLAALADARAKKLHYLQCRNDVDFARQNRGYFEDLVDDATLAAASAAYTKLTNAVVAHAVRLSQGQIRPPQYFDPSAASPPLAEPAPIRLVRAAVATGVPVVSLVGLRAQTLHFITADPGRSYAEYKQFCDGQYEPGAVAVLPSEKQYDFLRSGVKLDYTLAGSGAGTTAYWSWVYAQSPDTGTVTSDDVIKLTVKRAGHGYPPPEMRPYWGL